MFVDHVRVFAKAGDGGNGIVSFRREKFVPRGGPDGGDGGDGGTVVLKVDQHTDNLRSFAYDPKMIAQDGGHGQSYKRHGKKGKSFIGKVPPGTVVYRSNANDMKEASELERSDAGVDLEPVIDLTEEGQEFIVSLPGKGGKGNFHFRSSTNQAPEELTLGTEGEQGVYYLELRRIADAGFVGFPNAGKSTLMGALSANKPKIGAYPFTTLKPSIGVVDFPGYQRCTIADIPGLIEGASDNRGLGHEFLRHITRCHLLIFVIDMAGVDGREPIEDLQILRKEIKEYDEELSKFPWMIVANKMDVDGSEDQLAMFKTRFPKVDILPISAQEGDGLDDLRKMLMEKVSSRRDS